MACTLSFEPRAVRLEGTKADGVDVFRQVAWLLDYLTVNPDVMVQGDVDGLFVSLQNLVREWKDATVSDRKIVADSVFRIVRKLLCHHWNTYYSRWLFNMFTNTLSRLGCADTDTDVVLMMERLTAQSDPLDEWINSFYDGHLSDEVEAVVSGKKADVKPLQRSGRKKNNPNELTSSFSYRPDVDNRAQRLQAFYQALDRHFIMHADQQVFINIFMGVETNDYLVWTGDIIELKYLINTLQKAQLITVKGKGGIWQVVCARFKVRIKKKEVIDDSMTNDSYEIIDLSPDQFNKSGKLPTKHEKLDRVVRLLVKETDFNRELQEYLDSENERNDINDREDALANDLSTDLHF